jgi:hypothetical protein
VARRPWTYAETFWLHSLAERGLSNRQIGERIGRNAREVAGKRRAPMTDDQRAKLAASHRRWLAERGLSSLIETRWRRVYESRRAEHGWHADLKGLQLRIVNALWDRGPMTRPELVKTLGLRTDGVRPCHWFAGHGKRCLLGELCKRGLVEKVGRIRHRPGRGVAGTDTVYSLPLWIQRGALESSDAA